jgi:hypothetical protein
MTNLLSKGVGLTQAKIRNTDAKIRASKIRIANKVLRSYGGRPGAALQQAPDPYIWKDMPFARYCLGVFFFVF